MIDLKLHGSGKVHKKIFFKVQTWTQKQLPFVAHKVPPCIKKSLKNGGGVGVLKHDRRL